MVRQFLVETIKGQMCAQRLTSYYASLDWQLLLEQSGDFLITPALLTALKDAEVLDQLPDDVVQALTLIYNANSERNSKLLAVWNALQSTLADAGVHCLPLKGIAMLHHGIYPLKDRILADVDFFVAPSQLGTALSALSAAGYRQIENVNEQANSNLDPEFHPIDASDFRNRTYAIGYQLPALLAPKDEVVLEFHHRIAENSSVLSEYLNDLASALIGPQGAMEENVFKASFKDGSVKEDLLVNNVSAADKTRTGANSACVSGTASDIKASSITDTMDAAVGVVDYEDKQSVNNTARTSIPKNSVSDSTLDDLLVSHNFYHSQLKDASFQTGVLDLRHLLDVQRMSSAGVDVNAALQRLRTRLAHTPEAPALASFAKVCSEFWPETIDLWKDMSESEQNGVSLFVKRRHSPKLSRIIGIGIKMRRKARFAFDPEWQKSIFGELSKVQILHRLVRYALVRSRRIFK